jgi:hypothetical protein
MRITLYKDWDSLPSGFAKPSPYFSGREKELAQLKNILINKTSGSILIGAPRGIGKTDLVYKAISDVRSRKSKPKLLPIILNATQVNEAKDTEKISTLIASPKEIITSLITRTYAIANGEFFDKKATHKIFEKIATLYYQATAANYREEVKISGKNENSIIGKKTYERLTIAKISMNKKDLEDTIKSITPIGTVAIFFIIYQLKNIPYWIEIPTYLILLIIAIVSKAIDFSIETNENNKLLLQSTKSKNILEQAQILFLRDNSFVNLENGLKDILNDIQNSHEYKVVFVIDELDKIKYKDNPSEILEMIQIFKGLFNHSDALFIFISDTLVLEAATASRSQRKTNIHSTLFTERIYINRPTISDLKEYLKKITKMYEGDEKDLDSISDLFIFNAHMDFFMLPDVIRDYEEIFNLEGTVLNWDATSEDLQKINKQKIINAILEEGNYLYKELSNRQKNEDLREALYDIAERKNPFEYPKIPDDPDSEQKTRLQLELDTANLMYRAGIFERTEQIRQITTATGAKQVGYFTFTPTSAIGRSLTKLTDLLEYEKEYKDRFEVFEQFILKIYNFRAEILKIRIEDAVSEKVLQEVSRISRLSPDIYKNQKSFYEQLKKNPAKHDSTQEETKSLIAEIDKYTTEILNNNSLTIIRNVFEELNFTVHDLAQDTNMLGNLPALREHILNNSIPSILLGKLHESKEFIMIFLLNPVDTVINNITIIDYLRRHKRIYIMEIYTNSERMSNIPKNKVHRFEAILNSNFDINAKQIKKWLKDFPGIK